MTHCEMTTESLNHPNHAFFSRFLFVCLFVCWNSLPSSARSWLALLRVRLHRSDIVHRDVLQLRWMDWKSRETLHVGWL